MGDFSYHRHFDPDTDPKPQVSFAGTSVRPPRVGDDLPDDCKLYVGNIGQDVGDDALRAAFAPYGTVLHVVIPKVCLMLRAARDLGYCLKGSGFCWQYFHWQATSARGGCMQPHSTCMLSSQGVHQG